MLRLTIVTPERPFLAESCVAVTLPGSCGEMQIMSGHAGLLAELKAGIMTVQKNDQEVMRFMIGEGFVEIDKDQVNVLCEQARYKNEIDKEFEERMLAELQQKIQEHKMMDMEQKLLLAELSRSAARLSLFE